MPAASNRPKMLIITPDSVYNMPHIIASSGERWLNGFGDGHC